MNKNARFHRNWIIFFYYKDLPFRIMCSETRHTYALPGLFDRAPEEGYQRNRKISCTRLDRSTLILNKTAKIHQNWIFFLVLKLRLFCLCVKHNIIQMSPTGPLTGLSMGEGYRMSPKTGWLRLDRSTLIARHFVCLPKFRPPFRLLAENALFPDLNILMQTKLNTRGWPESHIYLLSNKKNRMPISFVVFEFGLVERPFRMQSKISPFTGGWSRSKFLNSRGQYIL